MRFSNRSTSLFLCIAASISSSASSAGLDNPLHHVATNTHSGIGEAVMEQALAQQQSSSATIQFQTHLDSRVSYAGGMAYHEPSNSVFLTGSRFVDNEEGSASVINSDCFLLRLSLNEGLQHDEKQYSDGGYEMGCSAVSISESSSLSSITVIGSTETTSDDDTNSQIGIVLNINEDNTSSLDTSAGTSEGTSSDDTAIGPVLSSLEMKNNKVQYPVAVVADGSTVYIACMSSNVEGTAPDYASDDEEYPNWTSSGTKKYGDNYMLDIHAYTISATDGSIAVLWSQEYGADDASVDVTGLIVKDDKLVITSSTNGSGNAFGTSDRTDSDGVITILDKSDGSLQGVTRSEQPVDDTITCICNDPNDANVFYVGGTFKSDNGGTFPILSKINLDQMDADWTRLFTPQDTSASAVPYGCTVAGDGSYMYFGGDVEGGAAMVGTSFGKRDVFVAKLATADGSIDWLKQVGSSGNDSLAQGGGIDADSTGNAIVYGTTDGSLAGTQHVNSMSEIFVFTMASATGSSSVVSAAAVDAKTQGLAPQNVDGPKVACNGTMAQGTDVACGEQGDQAGGEGGTQSVPQNVDSPKVACNGTMAQGIDIACGEQGDGGDGGTQSSTASVVNGGSSRPSDSAAAANTETTDAAIDEDTTISGVTDGVFGMQFEGPMYANAITYDASSETAYFTGSSYFANGAVTSVSNCYLGELTPLTGYVGAETYGNPSVTDGCSAIASGPKGGSLFLVGSTAKNGLYHEGGDHLDSSSRGFVMQLGKFEEDGVVEVVSGNSLTDEKAVYPASVVTDEDEEYMFIASMGSDVDHSTSDVFLAKNDKYPDPTHAGYRMFGYKYYLKLSKVSVVDPDGREDMETKWNNVFATDGGESVYLGGMVSVGDHLYVVGSTLGSSDVFGDNPVPALSGFVVKFDHSGESVKQARIYSQAKDNSYAQHLCADPKDPSSIYVVGRMKQSKDSTEAYVAKINTDDMRLLWLKGVGVGANEGKAFAEATGCAADSGKVFVAGIARDGSFIQSESSKGGDDIFVARFDTGTGDLEWARQIGSPRDESVATGGGITIGPNDSILVAGDTTGNLYRNRSQKETEAAGWQDWKELVVISLSRDGEVDQPVSSLQQDSSSSVASVTADNEPQVQEWTPQAMEAMAFEEYKPEIIGAIVVASLFVLVFFCWFCVRLQRKKKIAESQRRTMQVFKYLRHFDADDIDIRRSPAGGFHGKYLNDLAYGDTSRADAGSVSSSRSTGSRSSRSSRSSKKKDGLSGKV